MDTQPSARARLLPALAAILGTTFAPVTGPFPVFAQEDPDRAELVEDLGLGFPVTINLGTCTEVLPEPSFVIGNADPTPLLSLENEPRPLLDDEPGEDELIEDEDTMLIGAEEGEDKLIDSEDAALLGAGPASETVIWQVEEELPVELEALFLEPHVVVVHGEADELEPYIACGEIGEDLIDEGELAVPIRQIDGSAFAGVALFEEETEGFLGFEDEETGVAVFLFHGMNALPATPTPEATATATPEPSPTPTQPASSPTPEGAAAAPATPEGTAPAAPATPAGTASPAATGTPAGGQEVAETRTIEMVDIAFNPSEVTIPANTPVELVFPNNGAILHNFSLDEKNNPNLPVEPVNVDVQPGEQQSVVVNLPPGDYYFYCDVPGHEAAGMFGTLHVEAQ